MKVKIQRISERGLSGPDKYMCNTILSRESVHRLLPTNLEAMFNLQLLAKEKLAFSNAISLNISTTLQGRSHAQD